MDNYENHSETYEQPMPPKYVPPRPVSPFANSPYIMQQQYVQEYSGPIKHREKKEGGKVWKVIICTVLIFALVFGSCFVTAFCMDLYWQQKIDKYYKSLNDSVSELWDKVESLPEGDETNIILPDGGIFEGALTATQVYAMNVNAVVAITNQGQVTNIFGQVSQTASTGSGFIISQDGYVVSNYHVIAGATTLGVILSDGREYPARVVGYDQNNDISVLKIEAENLPYVIMGNSTKMVVGDEVAAIGNPLGELTSTLTMGHISAKDRRVNTDGSYLNMLQTDAAINSGNSGGPLFNMRGEVIGITTAKYSGTSNSGANIEGIGFAIPIDDVRGMIDDLCEYGYIKSGYLGISAQDVPQSAVDQYGLPLGALVVDVMAGSCASRAGIQKQDIIVDIGGHRVESLSDLSRALRYFDGGENTVITVYRAGVRKALDIKLDAKPRS